jgi:hypothetical protein
MARRDPSRVELDEASKDALLASPGGSIGDALRAAQKLIQQPRRQPESLFISQEIADTAVRLYQESPERCGPLTAKVARALIRGPR